jgi:hypothetical protein
LQGDWWQNPAFWRLQKRATGIRPNRNVGADISYAGVGKKGSLSCKCNGEKVFICPFFVHGCLLCANKADPLQRKQKMKKFFGQTGKFFFLFPNGSATMKKMKLPSDHGVN